MAKSTNGGKKPTAAEPKTTTEPKARRAPARRRTDKKTAEAPTAVASDLAPPELTAQASITPVSAALAASVTLELNPEEVRRRAFEIYCGRGCTNGCEVEDWLEAERQLRQSRTH